VEQIGRYEVTGIIGHGGMGTVYRAHDPAMQRDVAIKVLLVASDVATLARFRTETGATGKLRHKNIVTVYDCGETAGQPYLVMELLEGRTLASAIRKGPPLPLLEKTRILMEVAEGLRYAHANGIVHRDVEPSNVMLLEGGGVKIFDFGTALFMDPSRTRYTSPGFVVGAAAYMAPEQIGTGQADALTDIFSFGVMSYELVAGSRPLRQDSLGPALREAARTDPAPLCEVTPECPEALQRIVHRALAETRALRYPGLQELLFDLAEVHASLRRARVAELTARAAVWMDEGNLDQARVAVHQALEFDPSSEEAQALRRQILQRRERDRSVETPESVAPVEEPPAEPAPPDASAPAPGVAFNKGAPNKLALNKKVAAVIALSALALAGLIWLIDHPRTSHGHGTISNAAPVEKSATAPGQPGGAGPSAAKSGAPFDAGLTSGLRITKMEYGYPRKYRSIRDCDIENLTLHLFDDAGAPIQTLRLKDGVFRHKTRSDSLEVTAAPIEYLTAAGAPGPEYALLILSANSEGAASGREGTAQVFRLSDQRLSIVQEVKWDEQFEPESVSQYWSFDASTNSLAVYSVRHLPSDQPCCASAMDVITLRWTGSALAGDSLRTELLPRGKREGKALPAAERPGPSALPAADQPAPGATAEPEPRGVVPVPTVASVGSGARFALVIGNNRYSSLPSLNTAVSDAQGIERILKSYFGYQTELIVDGTRDQIVGALNRYRKNLNADASFILYYAGHGAFDKEAAKAYWLPVDAQANENTKWISADDITADLRGMRANHILIIADSCYSGALSRDAPVRLEPTGNRPRYIETLRRRGPSRTLLSSGGNEPVSDGGGGAHSVFTDALLKGLMGMPFEQFSIEELFARFIQEPVAGRSGQLPECSPLRNSGHEGGSFVFERTAARQ